MQLSFFLALLAVFLYSDALLAMNESGIDFLSSLGSIAASNHTHDHLIKRQPQSASAITPNGPLLYLQSWQPDHCDEQSRLEDAFLGTISLCRYALESLRTNGADEVFIRYFQAQSRGQVFKIFRSFLNLQIRSPNGPANPLFRNVLVGYGDPPAFVDPADHCLTRGDAAYVVNFFPPNPRVGGAWMSLCPSAFTRFPEFLDLPEMISEEKDTDHCAQYMRKGYAWEQLRGLSGLLLHELLHWNVLIASAQTDLSGILAGAGAYLADFNSDKTVPIQQADPPSGYGPWNAQRLRLVDGGNPSITLRSVENYVWYAHEVYWNKLCEDIEGVEVPLGPSPRVYGTQSEWNMAPDPPPIPATGGPAAYLLPENWNVPSEDWDIAEGVHADDGDETNDGFVPAQKA